MNGDEGDGQQHDQATDAGVEDKQAPPLLPPEGETGAEHSQPEPEQDTDEGSEWEEDEEDDDSLPSFEFRVETAKLLIELDEDNHAATQVCKLPDVAPCCCTVDCTRAYVCCHWAESIYHDSKHLWTCLEVFCARDDMMELNRCGTAGARDAHR